MNPFFQDLRDGLRVLAKTPGFTGAAVLTLALGIGANTVIFSVVNALFLRGLPAENPGALISLGFTHKNDVGLGLISYPDFEDIQRQTTVWADLFAYRYGVEGLSEGDRGVLPAFVDVQAYLPPNMAHTEGHGVTLTNRATRATDSGLCPGALQTQLFARPNALDRKLRT